MESKLILLSGFYLVPFLIPIFLPGWRTLGGFALVFLTLVAWYYFIKHNESGGIELSVEKALYWLVMIGAAAGLVTRALALGIHQLGMPGWITFVLTLTGAILPPVLLLAIS